MRGVSSSVSHYKQTPPRSAITLIHGPRSKCRLSFVVCLWVCDVRAAHSEGWAFRQYFAPSNSIKNWKLCVKNNGEKILMGNSNWSCKLNGKGIKNGVFDKYLALFRKRLYGHSYNGRRIRTSAISNDLEWPLTRISRSHQYSTNMSLTVQDRHIFRPTKDVTFGDSPSVISNWGWMSLFYLFTVLYCI